LDASAHLLSRAILSQSASVTCCTFARVVVLFVLHVTIFVFGRAILCEYREANCWYSALDIQLVYYSMKGESRRCQVLHSRARELVCKIFSYLKGEADAGMPIHDFAKVQDVWVSLSLSVRACVRVYIYIYICATRLHSCRSV
jgi:hypothetical protein